MTVTAAELASVAHAAAASACRAPTLWVGSLGYEYLRQRATTGLPGAHWQLASADRHREAHPRPPRAAPAPACIIVDLLARKYGLRRPESAT